MFAHVDAPVLQRKAQPARPILSRRQLLAYDIYAGYTLGMAKVLISIPDDLLERIDREAGARGSNRSRFLQDAARRELGWEPAVSFRELVRCSLIAHLLDQRDLISLLRQAGIERYTLIKNRLAGFVIDFVIVIGPA